MSHEAWAAWAAIGLTLLGFVAGASLWMGSLHSLVKAIKTSLQENINRNDAEHASIWERVDAHGDQLHEHDKRITSVEAKKNC
ncbi:MAG: hypothetical protein MI757_00050 [Pirellulales bacterium]|nr:hypothetical protein [Pirellulales bacterium]